MTRIHCGWLMKSPPKKKFYRPKSRRRFFVLDKTDDTYHLSYFKNESCKCKKGSISLSECQELCILDDYGGGCLKIIKLVACHKKKTRTFYLTADTPEDASTWLGWLMFARGLREEAMKLVGSENVDHTSSIEQAENDGEQSDEDSSSDNTAGEFAECCRELQEIYLSHTSKKEQSEEGSSSDNTAGEFAECCRELRDIYLSHTSKKEQSEEGSSSDNTAGEYAECCRELRDIYLSHTCNKEQPEEGRSSENTAGEFAECCREFRDIYLSHTCNKEQSEEGRSYRWTAYFRSVDSQNEAVSTEQSSHHKVSHVINVISDYDVPESTPAIHYYGSLAASSEITAASSCDFIVTSSSDLTVCQAYYDVTF